MPRTRGGAHGRLWEGGGGGAGAEGRGGAGAEGRAGGRGERLQPELSAASAASAARAAVHGPDGRRAARTRTRTPASGLSGPRGAATLSWAWDWLADLLHGSDVSTAGWSRRAAGALLLADRDVSHRGRPRHQEGEPGRGARARAFHACLALRGVNGPCEARRGVGGTGVTSRNPLLPLVETGLGKPLAYRSLSTSDPRGGLGKIGDPAGYAPSPGLQGCQRWVSWATLWDQEIRSAGLDLGWIVAGGQLPEVSARRGGLGPEPPPVRGPCRSLWGRRPCCLSLRGPVRATTCSICL